MGKVRKMVVVHVGEFQEGGRSEVVSIIWR